MNFWPRQEMGAKPCYRACRPGRMTACRLVVIVVFTLCAVACSLPGKSQTSARQTYRLQGNEKWDAPVAGATRRCLSLRVTTPVSVKAVGEERRFNEIMELVNSLYYTIEESLPGIGSYILTNAHRRRVLMKVNVRELYHISRLREDPTAQWDIRNIAHEMSALAKKALPITTMLLGGKSDYSAIYKHVYGRFPKVKSVPLP